MLDELADGHDARSPGELAELSELVGAVGALRVHADEEPALRLRPGCGIGLARSHREIMPRYAPPVTALADRLAARTLELVDIPSQSGTRRRFASTCSSSCRPTGRAEYAGDEAYLFAAAATARAAARSCSPRTTTRSRRRATSPGASPTARSTASVRAT